MRVQAPADSAISEAVGYGMQFLIAPGDVVEVPMVIGWHLVKSHGFGNVDGVALPARHPDDRPWTWREVITGWRVRG